MNRSESKTLNVSEVSIALAEEPSNQFKKGALKTVVFLITFAVIVMIGVSFKAALEGWVYGVLLFFLGVGAYFLASYLSDIASNEVFGEADQQARKHSDELAYTIKEQMLADSGFVFTYSEWKIGNVLNTLQIHFRDTNGRKYLAHEFMYEGKDVVSYKVDAV